MNKGLIEFYQNYVAEGSNIHEFAVKNGVTNTDCFLMVKMGKKYLDELVK